MNGWKIEKKVDLYRGEIDPSAIQMIRNDNFATVWTVHVMEGENEADLSGYSAKAQFLRSDDVTVFEDATIEGSSVTVAIPADACRVAGDVIGSIVLTKDATRVTVDVQHFYIMQTVTGIVGVPTEILDAILADYIAKIDAKGLKAFEVIGTSRDEALAAIRALGDDYSDAFELFLNKGGEIARAVENNANAAFNSAKGAAEAARTAVEASKASEDAWKASENARDDAQSAAEVSKTASGTASDKSVAAENARSQAVLAAQRAETAERASRQARDEAQTSKTGAENARDGAVSAKNSAERILRDARTTVADAVTEEIKRIPDLSQYETRLEAVETENAKQDSRIEKLENDPKIPEDLVKKVDDTADKLEALWKLSEGIVYDFKRDDSDGDKTVIAGAKQASVLSYGGKSLVWNQQLLSNGSVAPYGVNFATANGIIHATGKFTIASGQYRIAVRPKNSVLNHAYYHIVKTISGEPSGTWNFVLLTDRHCPLSQGRILTANADGQEMTPVLYMTNVNVEENVDWYLFSYLIDLTQLFGAGNEPTSIDDPRVAWLERYAEAHPEYNAGEIVSADVESVTARGANLWDGVYAVGNINTATGRDEADTDKLRTSFIAIPTRSVVTFSKAVNTGGMYYYLYDSDKNLLRYVDGNGARNTIQTENASFLRIRFNTTNVSIFDSLMVNLGDTVKPYAPYRAPIVRSIPSAIRQLDGYGWSAGSAYNSIEQTDDGKWLYHKRVGAVDLGKHNRVDKLSVAQGTMYRYVIDDIINTTNRMNMLCALYNTTSQGLRGELTVSGSARNVDFIDSRYDSVDAFKIANNGVMLYYELAEEVVTDVTDLMGDALAEFEVEAGGTITFDNSALLAVPNTVEYIRALKEVVS